MTDGLTAAQAFLFERRVRQRAADVQHQLYTLVGVAEEVLRTITTGNTHTSLTADSIRDVEVYFEGYIGSALVDIQNAGLAIDGLLR